MLLRRKTIYFSRPHLLDLHLLGYYPFLILIEEKSLPNAWQQMRFFFGMLRK